MSDGEGNRTLYCHWDSHLEDVPFMSESELDMHIRAHFAFHDENTVACHWDACHELIEIDKMMDHFKESHQNGAFHPHHGEDPCQPTQLPSPPELMPDSNLASGPRPNRVIFPPSSSVFSPAPYVLNKDLHSGLAPISGPVQGNNPPPIVTGNSGQSVGKLHRQDHTNVVTPRQFELHPDSPYGHVRIHGLNSPALTLVDPKDHDLPKISLAAKAHSHDGDDSETEEYECRWYIDPDHGDHDDHDENETGKDNCKGTCKCTGKVTKTTKATKGGVEGAVKDTGKNTVKDNGKDTGEETGKDESESPSHRKCCQKKFSTLEALHEHVIEEHIGSKKKGYECMWEGCTRCGKPIAQRQKAIRHLKNHVKYRRHKCIICGCAFSEPQNLRYHMRMHVGYRPFKCPTCNKGFKSNRALTIHIRTHTGDRPMICKFPGCGKRFADSSNLTKHMQIHKERRFQCSHCERKFTRKDQLNRHVQCRHPDKVPLRPIPVIKQESLNSNLENIPVVHAHFPVAAPVTES